MYKNDEKKLPLRTGLRVVALIAGIGLLLHAGCAYYNTFYRAKQFYKKGVQVQKESKSDKLNPTAVTNFDRAIEKCKKVIAMGGGWRAHVDDALMLMAKAYYGKRDYESALEYVDLLMGNYPDSRHVVEATFYKGLCYQKLRRFSESESILRRMLERWPEYEHKDEVLLALADGAKERADFEAAVRGYRELVSSYPEGEAAENAWASMAGIYYEGSDFDSAFVAYEHVADLTRDDETYFEAKLKAAECLLQTGRAEEAIGYLERLLPEQPERDEKGARVWLALGRAEMRRGDYERAIEYFDLVNEYFEGRNWSVDAWFYIGYVKEVYLNDLEGAKEAYEKAAGGRGQSSFKEQAKKRLENVRHLEQLLGSGEDEETPVDVKADAALKVAEFELYESKDPAGALERYREVATEFEGTEAAQRALFAVGWLLHSRFDSTEAAIPVFAEVAERYPASEQAEASVRLLRELGADSSLVDSLAARVARVKAALAESLAAVADSAAAPDSTSEGMPALGDSTSQRAVPVPAGVDWLPPRGHQGEKEQAGP